MNAFVGEYRFYSGESLRKHFRELVETSGQIDIANAWVSNSEAITLLLSPRCDLRIRAVVGVGGYATDPVALCRLGTHSNVSLKVYGKPAGPLFHPKFYAFQRAHFTRYLVGSMNLTNAGTKTNIECMLSFDDREKKASAEFDRFWHSGVAVEFAEFNFKAYEFEWKEKLAAVKEVGAVEVLD